jgi:RNA polymerase sigma-70 factor (ECF subfamily)
MNTAEAQEQFEALIDEHKKILYKVCNSYCRNRDDREDLAQEIVVELWRSFARFDPSYRFSTWMYRIALNVAISFCRRETARKRHLLAAGEHLLHTVDETGSEPEEIRLIYQFIEGLEALNKAILLLYLDGSSYREIADAMGITESNVATKICRLKQSMKQKFTQMASHS